VTETPLRFESGRVRRRFSQTVAATAGVTVLGIGGLVVVWDGKPTASFLVGIGVAFVALTAVSGWTLGRTRSAAGPQPLTAATWVTFARGWLLIAFTGFAFTEGPGGSAAWLPPMLFAVAVGLDAIDGALARRTDTVSELGARLDTEVDALLVFVGAVAVVVDGSAPFVFLGVGVARYAFVAGLRWRQRRDRPVAKLEPSQFRRATGAIVMTTILIAASPVPGPELSRAIAGVVSVPVLLHFAWDWLGVSGRV